MAKEKRKRNKFPLSKLRTIFAGKPVKITHTGNSTLRDGAGVCKTFHNTESGVDIELEDEHRYGFVPDTLTENSVEGDVGSYIAGRRRVQLA